MKKHLEKVDLCRIIGFGFITVNSFKILGWESMHKLASSSGINADDNEQFNVMNDMVVDALGVELSYNDDVEDEQGEEPPNEQAQFRQAQAQDPSHTRAPVLSPNVEPYPVDRDDEDGDEED